MRGTQGCLPANMMDVHIENLAGLIAAAIAIPLVYGALRKLFPVDSRSATKESYEELERKHHRTEVIGILSFFFVFTPTLGYAWWVVFVQLAEAHVAKLGDPVLSIIPHTVYWIFLVFFAGAITGAFPADLLVRICERGRYAEWIRYQELKYGFRQESTWFLLPILVVPTLVAALLMLNWYVVLTEDEVRVNPFFSSEHVYRYDEVAEIRTAQRLVRSGDTVRRHHLYAFTFEDGYVWSTRQGPTGEGQKIWSDVARIISERSGVAISEVDILE